jgi:hypothetical protein
MLVIWFNALNAELNPICHLLALFGARHILHVSRIRVNEWEGSEIVELFSFLFILIFFAL